MKRLLALGAAAVLSISCGPPSVRPVSYADPDVTCPGGLSAWNLEILDQRVDREGSDKMIAAVRDGVQKSFPGCRWISGSAAGAATISIEIHRFRSRYDYDPAGGGSWEAAVDWTVRARNEGGRILTEFQATEEVSRPNYRETNNEKESLSEAYQKALERTVTGLRSVPALGAVRRPAGTVPERQGIGELPGGESKSLYSGDLTWTAARAARAARMERKSQPSEAS